MRRQSNLWPIVSLALVAVVLLGLSTLKPREEIIDEEVTGWEIVQPPDDVTTMALMGDTLWTAGKRGVTGIDVETRELIEFPCDVRLTYVRHLLVEGDVMWIGHDNGLTRYSGGACTTYTAEDGLTDGRVNHVMRRSDSVLWVGSSRGAFYEEGDGWHRVTVDDGLFDNMVNVVFEDSRGGLWFGSQSSPRGGLSVLVDGEWSYFTVENGMPHNNVNMIMEDKDGTVWVATGLFNVGGAVHFERGSDGWRIKEVLDGSSGLPEGKTRLVYRDADGALWIGSENNGLARIEGGEITVLTEEDGLSNVEVKVIWRDPDGGLWMGTRNGVTILSSMDLDVITNK